MRAIRILSVLSVSWATYSCTLITDIDRSRIDDDADQGPPSGDMTSDTSTDTETSDVTSLPGVDAGDAAPADAGDAAADAASGT